ncbi:nuclear transport factor 2 family protein [Demequina mangrovi]|uniref:SnoaL-like domain-containing protein n=1 Tax=Demequina mangrovi TaxID=1043493 RepID=A0A1H6WHX9_9MICO|nr:nuclear transport factor 2 family protein [Demequina mangrovi]SEJ11965.1 SnoaL-like domain-containing protein [Demequina mangrovi]
MDSSPTARAIVARFWELMRSNDFASVGEVLSPDFVCIWPQSRELIRGSRAFGQVNTEYPAHGPWTFTVQSVVADESHVATDTLVSDGTVTARALSRFTVRDGLITELREYWPEDYDAPSARAHLVEPWPGDQGR